LDWTWSPYVAAYFAFVDYARHFNAAPEVELMGVPHLKHDDKRVYVYGLHLTGELTMKGEFDLVDPAFAHGARWKAQSGLFSRLEHPMHLDVESYLNS
jgi:hypothetical protein